MLAASASRLGRSRSFLGGLLLGLGAFLGGSLFLTGTDDGLVAQTILLGQGLLFGEVARTRLFQLAQDVGALFVRRHGASTILT